MSIISSELIHRSLLYFIWFFRWAVNLSPGELCLADYVLSYDIIFLKEHDLKTLISIAIYTTTFPSDWLYVHDRDVSDGMESARPESRPVRRFCSNPGKK